MWKVSQMMVHLHQRKLGNFVTWYSPQIITHYCSCMWVAMKAQHEVQGQSKEASGPWDEWKGKLKHR